MHRLPADARAHESCGRRGAQHEVMRRAGQKYSADACISTSAGSVHAEHAVAALLPGLRAPKLRVPAGQTLTTPSLSTKRS